MANTNKPQVLIYSDGGCKPNPGPGGWGAVLIFADRREEISGGAADTTNNRMELTAAIEALNALDRPHKIDFYTDSTYTRNGITKWIDGWVKKNWRGVKNPDLWRQLHQATQEHDITWHWVRGHAGDKENERVDTLASEEIAKIRAEMGLDEAPPPAGDIQVYIACSGDVKSNRGSWAAVVVEGDREATYSDYLSKTTVNAIILQAAISVLEQLKHQSSVDFYSDSDYLIQGNSKWIHGWVAKDWKSASGSPVKNRELWERLHRLNQHHHVQWHYLNSKENPHNTQLTKLLKASDKDSGSRSWG